MARPQKSGMNYFPHDTDASSDEKIEALRLLYGNDGYAFYFILLERIYRTPNFELDISDAETKQILVRKIAVTHERFLEMINTAINHDCFDKKKWEKSQVLTSDGIKSRAHVVLEKRKNMRKRYEEKLKVSEAETTPETFQNRGKVKKSKVKKSKVYKYTPVHLELANLLLTKIRENNPGFKEPNMDNWADEVEKMERIDKRTAEGIRFLINWAQSNSFWKSNILSTGKLREKFDTLVGQAKRDHEKGKPKGMTIGSISKQS